MYAEERMLALKKAYEDVISNISKEAASRVLASEKRALRLQPELTMVKEESLRMMMRLKQMMDSKISEEVAASLNKKHKIGELEEQLHEAEDIVRDLREELARARSELHRLRKENSKHPRGPKPGDPYQSNGQLGPKFKLQSTLEDCSCIPRARDHYLPSIISRGKEPSLFRSVRKLRIHACEEKNVLCDVISIPEKSDAMEDFGQSKVNKGLLHSKEETKSDIGRGPENTSEVTEQLPTTLRSRVIDFVYQRKRKRQTKEGSYVEASLETEKAETGVSKDSSLNESS